MKTPNNISAVNVLHLSAVKDWGGGEHHIENLCRELEVLAPELTNFIFCVKNGALHQRLKKLPYKLIPATLDFKMDPRYIAGIIKVCKEKKIDLIHIHDTTALTLAVMGDHVSGLPPFVFSKKTSFPIKNRKRTLYKYNYPKIHRILCVSDETKRVTAESVRDGKKLLTVYHGTSLHKKCANMAFDLREKLNLSPEIKLVGLIANHTWAKNLETFAEVVRHIVKTEKRSDFHFVQFGGFTKRTQSLKNKIWEYGLENNVSFLGFTKAASGFIPQLDVLLMTSKSEGIPGAIYEAFYHECPVVSTDVGGIPEIITHEENGLLAAAYDHKQLAEHVLRLSEDPELRKKFTGISKEKLHRSFTTEMMAIKTLEQYKIIADGRF